jgi:CrcB protein
VLVGFGAGDRWQAVVGTGFLGGYTTFSTASFETAGLLLDRRPLAAAANGLGVLVMCVAAASGGFALGAA